MRIMVQIRKGEEMRTGIGMKISVFVCVVCVCEHACVRMSGSGGDKKESRKAFQRSLYSHSTL